MKDIHQISRVMMRVLRWASFLGVCFSVSSGCSAAETVTEDDRVPTLSSDECAALGFKSEVLDCRSCDRMVASMQEELTSAAQKRALGALASECKQCCADLDVIDNGAEEYDHAVFEVCKCKYGRYPKVADFIRNRAEQFTRLEIKVHDALD